MTQAQFSEDDSDITFLGMKLNQKELVDDLLENHESRETKTSDNVPVHIDHNCDISAVSNDHPYCALRPPSLLHIPSSHDQRPPQIMTSSSSTSIPYPPLRPTWKTHSSPEPPVCRTSEETYRDVLEIELEIDELVSEDDAIVKLEPPETLLASKSRKAGSEKKQKKKNKFLIDRWVERLESQGRLADEKIPEIIPTFAADVQTKPRYWTDLNNISTSDPIELTLCDDQSLFSDSEEEVSDCLEHIQRSHRSNGKDPAPSFYIEIPPFPQQNRQLYRGTSAHREVDCLEFDSSWPSPPLLSPLGSLDNLDPTLVGSLEGISGSRGTQREEKDLQQTAISIDHGAVLSWPTMVESSNGDLPTLTEAISKLKKRKRSEIAETATSDTPSKKVVRFDTAVKAESAEKELLASEMVARGLTKDFQISWLGNEPSLVTSEKKRQRRVYKERCRLLVCGYYKTVKTSPCKLLRNRKIMIRPEVFTHLKMRNTIKKLAKLIGISGGELVDNHGKIMSSTEIRTPIAICLEENETLRMKTEHDAGRKTHFKCKCLLQFMHWFDRQYTAAVQIRTKKSKAATTKAMTIPAISTEQQSIIHCNRGFTKIQPIPENEFYGHNQSQRIPSPIVIPTARQKTKKSHVPGINVAEKGPDEVVKRSQQASHIDTEAISRRHRVEIPKGPSGLETDAARIARYLRQGSSTKLESNWLTSAESKCYTGAIEQGQSEMKRYEDVLRIKWLTKALIELKFWTGDSTILDRHYIYLAKRHGIYQLKDNDELYKVFVGLGGCTRPARIPQRGENQVHTHLAVLQEEIISRKVKRRARDLEIEVKTELEFLVYVYELLAKENLIPEEIGKLL
ncbi:uncharacterized protein IL334_006037 [Kwoniella shivajii]|uniref:Uncharacterized protein n=1 Tax=Kwoniella shivajii TaxID=564305 RepID=A0ABZ1D4T2_9TREE|nr:hypothetical protein IL334_006037 [Kwoniella shivajii]